MTTSKTRSEGADVEPQRYAVMAKVADNPDSWTLLGFVWDGTPSDKHIPEARVVKADTQFFSRAATRVFETAHTDYVPEDIVGDSVRVFAVGESVYTDSW